ncbi:MAG: CheR family methyltransferase [Bacteroidia bacterium]
MSEEKDDLLPSEEISDEELSSLTTAIKTRYGMDFTSYEKKSLKRGVARLIARNHLGSLLGLWSKILKDRDFINNYVDELLVNLTELFRNPELWQKLKSDVLNQYTASPIIKIWHAGCSTGEEIYSMAIVLNEKRIHERARIVATDLSTQAMVEARAGQYSSMLWNRYQVSFTKYNPFGRLDQYFTKNEHGFQVNKALQKNITFKQQNLVQDPPESYCDIIVCRNVMIYFDETLKVKVLTKFHTALKADGYLIIGYYDLMPESAKNLFSIHDAANRIYRKIV